jgi:hypothetical protein
VLVQERLRGWWCSDWLSGRRPSPVGRFECAVNEGPYEAQ